MTQPLVSIAVICYNQQDFIEQTILSAAEQDWDHLEVIVADDGSTDETPAIVADLARRYPGRVIPLLGGPNIGVTANSNRSIKPCRGKYIAQLGGDDLFLPGKVAAQVAWLEADARRVYCAHDVEYFLSSTGETLGYQSDLIDLQIQGAGPERFLVDGMLYPPSAAMIRASAIPSRGFDERLPYASDWKLALDCLMDGGVYGCVPGVYTRYRRHKKNISVTNRADCFRDELVTLAILEADHPHLAALCRLRRAKLFYREAVSVALPQGEVARARQQLALSFITAPERSLKLPLHFALSYLPEAARGQLVHGGHEVLHALRRLLTR